LPYSLFRLKQFFTHNLPFSLECGEQLPKLEIAYDTFGTFSPAKNNVVWVFHALTANSDASDWWSGLIGEGKLFNPEEHFIVCANIIGSCYGSSGPLSINPKTSKPYYSSFPMVTIRDMVKAHRLLQEHLGIKKIKYGLGGSMGGYQLMEWAIEDENLFENMILLTTSAQESSWGKAIHEAQRLAIEADPTWRNKDPNAGKKGLMAARGIGMLTYRNYEIYGITQKDESDSITDFKACSYIRYQGEKLANRFNTYSYHLLTRTMDSHSLNRAGMRTGAVERTGAEERAGKSTESILNMIKSKTLVIGISSDILCPVKEQEFLAEHIPGSRLVVIDSPYGHDGFLIEFELIIRSIKETFV